MKCIWTVCGVYMDCIWTVYGVYIYVYVSIYLSMHIHSPYIVHISDMYGAYTYIAYIVHI